MPVHRSVYDAGRRHRGHVSRRTSPAFTAEALERRVLLTLYPLGPEIEIERRPGETTQRDPSVASDPDGNFVIVYSRLPATGGPSQIYGQRYDTANAPVGPEFAIASGNRAEVAMDADGDFVVTYNGFGADVYARRFDADGTPLGGQFKVNATTGDFQSLPVGPANGSIADGEAAIIINDDDPIIAGGPRVTQVYVGGPQLIGAASVANLVFRNAAGVTAFGYPVPSGDGQIRTLPWTGGITHVAIRFDRDVAGVIERDDLRVRGLNAGSYAAVDFGYDAPARTGLWTLGSAIVNDKVRIELEDDAANGVAGLDGEWTGPDPRAIPPIAGSGYPSGDGVAGGDF